MKNKIRRKENIRNNQEKGARRTRPQNSYMFIALGNIK